MYRCATFWASALVHHNISPFLCHPTKPHLIISLAFSLHFLLRAHVLYTHSYECIVHVISYQQRHVHKAHQNISTFACIEVVRYKFIHIYIFLCTYYPNQSTLHVEWVYPIQPTLHIERISLYIYLCHDVTCANREKSWDVELHMRSQFGLMWILREKVRRMKSIQQQERSFGKFTIQGKSL
mgnify:CR=1 FL=1